MYRPSHSCVEHFKKIARCLHNYIKSIAEFLQKTLLIKSKYEQGMLVLL